MEPIPGIVFALIAKKTLIFGANSLKSWSKHIFVTLIFPSMNFKKTNIITGWIVCAIACTVYILTREATVSFWDCGEFISCAYKLQISHPPGAPLFIMLGRLFIILFGDNPHTAALHVNLLSSICSGITIMFLFWSVTHLGRKLLVKDGEVLTTEQSIAVIAAGAVGALAFTFSDSFWFSAVEGIVFGVSPLFISIGFWAILKWENEADQPHADRWVILIAYLIGLSIGVHLLSLLCIPAVFMTYYFRRYKVTMKGTILAFLVACIITGLVQKILIQDTVKLIGDFELLFVNGLGLPFNSGSYVCIALFIIIIVLVLRWAKKHEKYYLRLGFLCIAFILIGYSSYFMIVIRANADPAINMQDVSDPMKLVSYLDRTQYGTWPLLTGPDFTAKPTGQKAIGKIYSKNEKDGRYDVVGAKYKLEYDQADVHLFPRLWDDDNSQGHVDFYKQVLGLSEGQAPSFGDNVYFFLHYQFYWMYFRYFLWNFAGRQNDIQGLGNVRDGNWISGIPFLDNWRLGDQSKLPETLKNNKAHNRLFMLPFILGLFGLCFQFNRDRRHGLVVFLLFFFSGIAIIIYLNQAMPQPRERDYSYVGSFYAFAIWIGLGVLSVYNFLKKKVIKNGKLSAVIAGVICLLAVPLLMSCQEWDDHDRHQKTLARDIAEDYLHSCDKNAILFTGGDNDTYPLWYVQEVEGVRPDIRIIITTLLGTDWFINQLATKVNESPAIAMDWTPDKYLGSKRDYLYYYPGKVSADQYFPLEDVMNFIDSDDPKAQITLPQSGETMNYLPTQNFILPVDKQKVLKNGTVPLADSSEIVSQVRFSDKKNAYMKNDLAELQVFAANHWNRPIYFTNPSLSQGLDDYMETDGLTYRLVPYQKANDTTDQDMDNVNTDKMYEVLMHQFHFGGAQIPGTYFDEPNRRELETIRSVYERLGITLAEEGKKDSALNVLNYCDKNLLTENYPYGLVSGQNIHDYTSAQYANAYYMAGDPVKARSIAAAVMADCSQQLSYYNSLSADQFTGDLQQEAKTAQYLIGQLQAMQSRYGTPAQHPPDTGGKATPSQPADSGK